MNYQTQRFFTIEYISEETSYSKRMFHKAAGIFYVEPKNESYLEAYYDNSYIVSCSKKSGFSEKFSYGIGEDSGVSAWFYNYVGGLGGGIEFYLYAEDNMPCEILKAGKYEFKLYGFIN